MKERLLTLNDLRISKEGVLVIKAQTHRSQAKNKGEAIARLQEIVASVAVSQRVRRPTKPTRIAQRKRLEGKSSRGLLKEARAKVRD